MLFGILGRPTATSLEGISDPGKWKSPFITMSKVELIDTSFNDDTLLLNR
jgi:hypothetical protein